MTRAVELGTQELTQMCVNMIEWETITTVSSGDGEAPFADTDDGDDLQILEPYGLASRPSGSATTLALAPGGEMTERVALGVSSTLGRPSTDAGDVVVWSSGGHTIKLDDDGGITITAKDGQVIELPESGDIVLTPKPGSKVRVGGAGGSQPAAKATITRTELQTLVTAISSVTPAGPDTGALIVSAVAGAFLSGVADLGSSNVEVLE